MLDDDFVQLLEALGLGNLIIDHDGVDVLHVGDADELVDGSVVALVTFERRIGGLPLLMRHVERGHVQNIRLARVDDVHLRARDGGGIVQLLPEAKEGYRRPASHPVLDNVFRLDWIPQCCDVSYADVICAIVTNHTHNSAVYVEFTTAFHLQQLSMNFHLGKNVSCFGNPSVSSLRPFYASFPEVGTPRKDALIIPKIGSSRCREAIVSAHS